MTTQPTTAIVILNWNGVALLPRFLPSVIRHSTIPGVSVYVADNGSTDTSVAWLEEHYPSVRILHLQDNHGFSQGYNLALREVEADYFVLLNSDVEVTGNWLRPCIQHLEQHPGVAALQPKVLSHLQRNRFEYAGAAGGYIDRWGFPFCRGRILNVTEEDTGQYDNRASLFWATGACLFIRSSVFTGAGGFDADFFAHMEEIDLCWRLKNQGWKIAYEPQSVVYHLGGATLSYHSPAKVFLNFRNNLWMLLKNLPGKHLFPVLVFRMILDGIAAIRFLLTGKFHAFYSVLKAHLAFYGSFIRFYRKRRLLLKKVVQTRHPEIFRGTMVFRFYILKQTIFSKFRFFPPMED